MLIIRVDGPTKEDILKAHLSGFTYSERVSMLFRQGKVTVWKDDIYPDTTEYPWRVFDNYEDKRSTEFKDLASAMECAQLILKENSDVL